MSEVATKPKPVAESPAPHGRGFPVARVDSVIDRTRELSDGVLTSLETGERAAVESVGQFVITIERAWPEQVAGTSDVVQKITQSGFQAADRLVHTQYELVRNVIDSAARSLHSRDAAQAGIAH